MTTIELIAALTTMVARNPECSTVEVKIPDWSFEEAEQGHIPKPSPDYAHDESYRKGWIDATSSLAGRWDFSVEPDGDWPFVFITPTVQNSNP